jgi:hypothetical protein
MTQAFGTWLKDQQHRDDPIGDLANDFISACKWRKETPDAKTTDGVQFQMACLGASNEAYAALDQAVAEWKASR